MEQYCRAGLATDDNIAHARCMLNTSGYKHILRIYNTYCFFTATMLARKRLNVTLYIQCLSVCLVEAFLKFETCCNKDTRYTYILSFVDY